MKNKASRLVFGVLVLLFAVGPPPLMAQGSGAAFGLSMEVMARVKRASGETALVRVTPEGALRSGDEVQIRLSVKRDAYVYVIAYGSSRSALLLHPFSGKAEEGFLRAGEERVVPGPERYLPLDSRTGEESLFALASARPLGSMAKLLVRMEASGDDHAAVTATVGEAFPELVSVTFRHLGNEPLVGVSAAPSEPAGRKRPGSARAVQPAPADQIGKRPADMGSLSPDPYEEPGVLSAEGRRIGDIMGVPPQPGVAETTPVPERSAPPPAKAPPSAPAPPTPPDPQLDVKAMENVYAALIGTADEDAAAPRRGEETTPSPAAPLPRTEIAGSEDRGQHAPRPPPAASPQGSAAGGGWLSRLSTVFGLGVALSQPPQATAQAGIDSASAEAASIPLSPDSRSAQAAAEMAGDRQQSAVPDADTALEIAGNADVVERSVAAPLGDAATSSGSAAAGLAPPVGELLLALPKSGAEPENPVSSIDLAADGNVSSAVALVVTPTASGSGVLLDDAGHVLANWHVVRGYTSVSISFKAPDSATASAGRTRTARVVRLSRTANLALLRVDDLPAGVMPVRLGTSEISSGDMVHALGHPDEATLTHTLGKISQVRAGASWYGGSNLVHRATIIEAEVLNDPGSVGAPLFNSRLELVAIGATPRSKRGVLIGISAETIRAFLEARPAKAQPDAGG